MSVCVHVLPARHAVGPIKSGTDGGYDSELHAQSSLKQRTEVEKGMHIRSSVPGK